MVLMHSWKYRKTINDDQSLNIKNYFEVIFKKLSSRLVDYTNPRINVTSQKKINDKYTIVNSVLNNIQKTTS